ncbi:uncharacterized protein [Nicotiana tomentosiformis]|uniref:uncharacterized protein n=1 Tax=Nicotiana tomentosiformis TaxID=4098 RepID=UPI00388C7D37
MVAAWGESSDDDDGRALIAIEESDEETEVSVFHLKDKIKFLSKERLYELLLELIDESEDVNNEKEQLSKECVLLKAKCKNLELRAYEAESENIVLKNQVHALDTTVLEHKSEKKLGTVQVKGRSQIWYMDNGCSKYMTGSKNQFLSLEELKGGNVSFGNGKKGLILKFHRFLFKFPNWSEHYKLGFSRVSLQEIEVVRVVSGFSSTKELHQDMLDKLLF